MQLEQIQKQLHKLIDVLKVQEVTECEHIERELMLVKVKASGFARAEVKRTADISAVKLLMSQLHNTQCNWPVRARNWMLLLRRLRK